MNILNSIRKRLGLDTYEETNIEAPENELTERGGVFSTHYLGGSKRPKLMEALVAQNIQRSEQDIGGKAIAMDSGGGAISPVKPGGVFSSLGFSDAQLAFFGAQGFIGYQMMALLAQNWLINKACLQPAKDAVRNGFELTVNDGTTVPPEVLAFVAKRDKELNLTKNLLDFGYYGRMFGIRIAKFDVVSTDEDYYEKPFNPDGITPGSYRGITQIDPYWIVPELNGQAAAVPDSRHFYEPTYWQVQGKRIHRSHLVIFRGPEVADILKPTYLYGGMSIPQLIYERVYAAERTANEAPMLAQSKRETVLHVDVDKAVANQAAFEEKMGVWTGYRNNWGVKVVGTEEVIEQFETSLADLDTVIMTQYQLVAAVAGVPVTKLLGTVPKGFNSTGEYDEASYHEELESLQAHDLTRLVERHHLCVIRSDVAEKFPEQPRFNLTVTWNELDAPTTKEQAEVNKIRAETDTALVAAGAIDGEDIRNRLINDPESGYNGIETATPELDLGNDLDNPAAQV
jgi:phage-related protein (TIGR01555 family)